MEAPRTERASARKAAMAKLRVLLIFTAFTTTTPFHATVPNIISRSRATARSALITAVAPVAAETNVTEVAALLD